MKLDLDQFKKPLNTLAHPPVKKLTQTAPQVITCFPVVTGNGAKHTALNLALTYKQKYPTQRVALVDFNFVYPTLLGNETSYDNLHGIDNLLDKIDSDQLTESLFRENLIKVKNGVFLLKGTQLKYNHSAINRKHVEQIFKNLRQSFDRIFVNVSSADDNAGTVYGLHHSDCVLFILNNNYTNLMECSEKLALVKRYFHQHAHVFGMFNKFNQHSKTEFGTWIFENKLEMIEAISYDEKTIDGADWFGGFLNLVPKKQVKVQTPYEQIIDKLI